MAVAAIDRPRSYTLKLTEGLRGLLAVTSTLFLVLCMIGFALRPDELAAVTIIPAWAWWFGGSLLCQSALLRLRRNRRKRNRRSDPHRADAPDRRQPRSLSRTLAALAFIGWLIFGAIYIDELPGILRLMAPANASVAGQSIRVVSLNCAAGSKEAADEGLAKDADIVLLQESPTELEVRAAASQALGTNANALRGYDASIVSRWPLAPIELPRDIRAYATAAYITPPGNQKLLVVSLRLTPVVFRFDLWSPDCWKEQIGNRRFRRQQVVDLVEALRLKDEKSPIILGGDMNAPAADGAMDPLKPQLRDVWREAGRGWGDTIVNDMPMQRIDQIWVSAGIKAFKLEAVKTANSDHRAVVGEVRL